MILSGKSILLVSNLCSSSFARRPHPKLYRNTFSTPPQGIQRGVNRTFLFRFLLFPFTAHSVTLLSLIGIDCDCHSALLLQSLRSLEVVIIFVFHSSLTISSSSLNSCLPPFLSPFILVSLHPCLVSVETPAEQKTKGRSLFGLCRLKCPNSFISL
jgi:hypothetical protein